MKKYIFFLVGLCCALLPAMADQPELLELKASDANIIGHVLDKKTGEHLSYITIALKGTTIGTVTDATGHYFLKNLPEGNFVLEASSVGYKTISRNVSLRKGKTLEENFELEEDAVALDGVVVSANRSVTKRRLAPTLVNVVDMKMFENTNSPTLSQGLNFQPGVRVGGLAAGQGAQPGHSRPPKMQHGRRGAVILGQQRAGRVGAVGRAQRLPHGQLVHLGRQFPVDLF